MKMRHARLGGVAALWPGAYALFGMATLRALSINIHKGFSSGNRRFILPRLRDAVREVGADLVFLQEVLGEHKGHASRVPEWPSQPQMEYLADSVWTSFAYGQNAIYEDGHHGNAILSKFNIEDAKNHDISSSRAERRGFLHGRVRTPCGVVHVVCLHLSLMHRDRVRQFQHLRAHVRHRVPHGEAVIIAGDFNDWGRRAHAALAEPAGLQEAFRGAHGREARTFPSFMPMLPLDRIYYRGLRVRSASVLRGEPWTTLSDHLGLLVEFETA